MTMPIVPVLLAGGIGERFWPLSRSARPKQLLPLVSRRTMLEETLLRIRPLCGDSIKPLVVTNAAIGRRIRAATRGKHRVDLIVEPCGRDTAPAIVIAALAIERRYGPCIMAVLTADHAISPRNEYVRALRYAAQIAQSSSNLVVFGIPPSRPDTGYGYIELGAQSGEERSMAAYRAKKFVEKPDLKTAVAYCKSGQFLWNSGMFVWKTSTILEEFGRYAPRLLTQAKTAARAGFSPRALERFYGVCEKKSIDYAVMERSRRVEVVTGCFKWDDVGSWDAVARVRPGNERGTTVVGRSVFERDCSQSIIYNESGLTVAAVGLSDMVLVVTEDAVLAMPRAQLPRMKEHLAAMKTDGRFNRKLF